MRRPVTMRRPGTMGCTLAYPVPMLTHLCIEQHSTSPEAASLSHALAATNLQRRALTRWRSGLAVIAWDTTPILWNQRPGRQRE